MSKQLKLRRGTTAQHATFTGGAGEVTVDTTKNTAVVHDGSTAGGTPLAKESAVNARVVQTSSTGSAVLPSGTEAQRDGSPSAGYLRFNTDIDKPEIYNGTAWGSVGGGATGGGSDAIFIENGQTVTVDYTITSGNNAGTFGPVSIASGVTVTVPSGSVWTVI